MAPSRKSRSINKRYSYINDVGPKKEVEDGNKNKRKRKLSDMLGSQWSKEELQRFYEAYRKYGKDWKKLSGAVRNRSVEMIEALYTMNKAYLSLPEGTASVAGLIAMMTDHYSVLEGSDSEQESHDGSGASQRAQKRSRGKVRTTASKGLDDNDPSQQVGSSSGCLSLLKKKRSGSRPRAVGKRTPRVPVSFAYDRGDKLFSPGRPGLKLKADAEEDVAHEIALALTKASQTPTKKPGKSTSPTENDRRLLVESGKASATVPGSRMDEGAFEGSLGSMEADNADFMKVRNMTNREGFGSIEIRKKGKKFYGKKPEVDETGNDLDDIKEACSGTEGQDFPAAKGKHEPEVLGRSYSKSTRKRSKKVLFGEDGSPGFDALQALADLSLMMPGANVETEHEGDRGKTSGAKLNEVEVATSRRSKFGKVQNHDEDAQEAVESTGLRKKKAKSLASKMQTIKVDAHTDSQVGKFQKIETADEMKRTVSKGKRSSPSAYLKQGKLGKQLEGSLSTSDNRKDADSALATVQFPSENPVNLPTKVRSKRKADVPKSMNQKDLKTSEDYLTNEVTLPISSFGSSPLIFKNKLSHCLSSKRVQRWCTFEWFYSAVDYPWFAKREFVEYLDHVGLGHIPRLTRVEWGVIRSSLGKPRRFSLQFLKEEKEKLNQYRDSVRKHYSELRTGTREGLPADLARPLSVGQRVIAIHPRTREIHDGRVLTVDESRCRVQFDQPKLGVELVMDIDCMPSNPLENMPASLSKRYIAINNSMERSDHMINERSNVLTRGPLLKEASIENPETGSAPSLTLLPASLVSLQKQAKDDTTDIVHANVMPAGIANEQSVTNSQALVTAQVNQAKEADVRAIAELTRALEKKDAVVTELRRMNDDVLRSQDRGDNSLKDSEPFKKQYASVLLQLSEVNDQVTSSLISLRQRNTYEESFPVMPVKLPTNADDIGGLTNCFDQSASEALKSTSHVVEIVDSSRTKAQSMVNAAMQAISSLKDGGNSVKEDAVDYLHTRLTLDESSKPTTKLSAEDSTNSNIAIQEQSTSRTSNPTVASNAPGPMSNDMFDGTDTVIPADLIAHCVATLLMIQKCTERQFPPADVAQILDSAVTSLKPCCSENLPIYSEIQKCMGIIRSQIMALIPT